MLAICYNLTIVSKDPDKRLKKKKNIGK